MRQESVEPLRQESPAGIEEAKKTKKDGTCFPNDPVGVTLEQTPPWEGLTSHRDFRPHGDKPSGTTTLFYGLLRVGFKSGARLIFHFRGRAPRCPNQNSFRFFALALVSAITTPLVFAQDPLLVKPSGD